MLVDDSSCIAEVDNVSVYRVQPSNSAVSGPAAAAEGAVLLQQGTVRIHVLETTSPSGSVDIDHTPEARFVLVLNDWTYLLAGQPILSLGNGQYILPSDAGSETDPPYLFILPPDAVEFIEDVLNSSCDVRTLPPTPSEDVKTSEPLVSPAALTVASGIVKTGEVVAFSVMTVASYLGGGLRWTGEKLTTMTAPVQEKVVVSEGVKSAASAVKMVAGAAVSATGSVLGVVSTAAGAVGSYAATALRGSDIGKRVASIGSDGTEAAARRRAAVATVAASSIVAALTIWESLENAGRVILKDTATATHTVVEHRYGPEAGKVAKDVGGAVVDAAHAAVNVRRIGVRPFAKAAAVAAVKSGVTGGSSSVLDAAPVPPPRKHH